MPRLEVADSFFEQRLRELEGAPDTTRPAPDHEAHHLEDRLARLLRGASLGPFLRRARLGPYEVDFLFERERLAVELDGFVHLASPVQAKDRRKDRYLAGLGYRVLHVENRELVQSPDRVVDRIRRALRERRSLSR